MLRHTHWWESMAANGTCFVQFVPERNILGFFRAQVARVGHANNSLENESFSFLSE